MLFNKRCYLIYIFMKKISKGIVKSLSLALFFSFFLFFVTGESAKAQTAVPVTVVPATQNVNVGAQASLAINVTSVSNLYGFQFNIRYDPSILSFVSLTEGTFIGTASQTYWVDYDASTPGLITSIAATRKGTASVSGSGTFVTLVFNGTSAGISTIQIENLKLITLINYDVIPSTAQNGEVRVEAGIMVDLKANSSDGPIDIPYDSDVDLSWSSSGATSCIASGAWSGTKAINGSETTAKISSSKEYILTCTSSLGSAKDSVKVNVSEEPDLNLNGDLQVAVDGKSWQDSLSGIVPLTGVDLKASIENCTINYTFWCNCNDSSTSISETIKKCGQPIFKKDNTHDNPLIVNNLCNYPAEGTYYAKAIIEKYNTEPAEDRAMIVVVKSSAPPEEPKKPDKEQKIPFGNPLRSKKLWELASKAGDYLVYVSIPLSALLILTGAFNVITAAGLPLKLALGKHIIIFTALGLGAVFSLRGIISFLKHLLGG